MRMSSPQQIVRANVQGVRCRCFAYRTDPMFILIDVLGRATSPLLSTFGNYYISPYRARDRSAVQRCHAVSPRRPPALLVYID
jgi:hypothetical protein